MLSSRLHQVLKILFSKPLDSSTPEGRSQERYRRATLTTLVMMAARVSNILTGIVTVPITLNYLGEDLFGVWMVLMSVVGFLSFYDLGIGVGLRNLLIECVAKDDYEKPKRLIGNALMVTTMLAAVMIVIVFTVLPLLPWGELIKCKNPASVPQILPAAQAVIVMFALGLPIAQLQNIANAYQRGYWGYLCFLIGRIFGFLFVLWSAWTQQALWVLAGGYVGIPFMVTLVGWVVFLIAAPELRPWSVRFEQTLIRPLFGIGFFVMLHHLSFAMVNTSAIMLIANTIDAASAVPYSVTTRLLGVSGVITGSMMVGVSVAVGEAWHRQDYAWVKKTVRRSELMMLLVGIVPLILFLFAGQPIILWWTDSVEAVPSFFLLLACVLLISASAVGSIYTNCLMAMNYVRFVAITKFIAGIFVVLFGYAIGVVTQSPTMIAYLQFVIGALIPSLLFWRTMRGLLNRYEGRQPDTEELSVSTTTDKCVAPTS